MLYHLLYAMSPDVGGLNVVRYVTFRTAAASLTALFIAFLVGPALIRALAGLRAGQPIREIGPAHQVEGRHADDGRAADPALAADLGAALGEPRRTDSSGSCSA